VPGQGVISGDSLRLTLRAATNDDSALLFGWVNSPDSLASKLLTVEAIDRADHDRWLEQRLSEQGTQLWIAESDGKPVGQVRLQQEPAGIGVDIYVAPDCRGRGVGKAMLSQAGDRSREVWPGLPLLARVRVENDASIALFKGAGFVPSEDCKDHLMFVRSEATSRVDRVFDKSNALYKRALKTIPLASQTFSKSALNFVEGASPLFLSHGRGAYVWDVDGNAFVDHVLGLLPVVLGYCDPDVDHAIEAQLRRGISFSLATELEVELAENLVRLLPSAEMVRFGKNGSDATSGAVRLARAVTGRDRILLAGYHGWHDWYIGTTSRNMGVPETVRGLSTKLPFNDLAAVAQQFDADPNGIAGIILEPAGTDDPADGYLQGLRDLCDRYGSVLIFDEIVTGFRADLRGAQHLYGVTPDLSAFGKAMANGMPLSALVGRASIMSLLDQVFVSSTFGGETLSLAAALATIGKLEREDGVQTIHTLGRHRRTAFNEIFQRHGLADRLLAKGPDWRPVVAPVETGEDAVIVVSLLRQEMAAAGILIGGGVNICLAHADEGVASETLASFDHACGVVAAALSDRNPKARLRGRPVRPVFQVRQG